MNTLPDMICIDVMSSLCFIASQYGIGLQNAGGIQGHQLWVTEYESNWYH